MDLAIPKNAVVKEICGTPIIDVVVEYEGVQMVVKVNLLDLIIHIKNQNAK